MARLTFTHTIFRQSEWYFLTRNCSQLIDILFSGFEADLLSEELSRFTPVPIPYKPPFNWGLLTTVILGIVSFLLSLRFIIPVLASRWTWAAVVIIATTVFTGGFMFVRIRGSPWVGSTKKGLTWMAGGYQNQYGMEVQIVSGICKHHPGFVENMLISWL